MTLTTTSPLRSSRSSRHPVDILYVAAGTTAGLCRADDAFLKSLEDAGVQTALARGDFSLPGSLRQRVKRSLLATDVHECLALRRATVQALRRYRPRAIVYASTHAALLQGARQTHGRVAIRFDTPAQMSRRGRGFGFEHRLERRRFASARMLLPTGERVPPEIHRLMPAGTAVVALPIPIDRVPAREPRSPIAVTYAANPAKKGLDLVVRAWTELPVGDRRLVVTGIDREPGLRYLHQHGLPEPPGTEWTGLLDFAAFRALTRRAEIYIAASRYENYGISQLEALADGALLVTLPSAGALAALPVARRLAPELVASDMSAGALTAALGAAIQVTPDQRAAYERRATELLQSHSYAELQQRVRTRVLPALLG